MYPQRTCPQCGLPSTLTDKKGRQRKYCSQRCAGAAHHARAEARFWSRFQRVGECLLWTGATYPYGYGAVRWDGRTQAVHRVVWQLKYGSIPAGMEVCHNCPGGDNPLCVEHLFLGTHRENLVDAVTKWRAKHGDRHWNAGVAHSRTTRRYQKK